MATESENSSLLDTLQRLRSKMLLMWFNRRMSPTNTSGHPNIALDIGERLSGHIDTIAQTKGISPSELHCEIPSQRPPPKDKPAENQADEGVLKQTFVELANYFRTRRTGTTLNPHVAEMMRASTWEHLHTALRLAREGNICMAKLHADIANNALKEAAHHMGEDEYNDLKEKVDEQLSALSH